MGPTLVEQFETILYRATLAFVFVEHTPPGARRYIAFDGSKAAIEGQLIAAAYESFYASRSEGALVAAE